ncbi:TetR/AcrR family transcriptional regulator [Nonomuraea muscovyensis]|uniref:AcrR family transcriptional regulator n=1 Tax=Nonomuraea muscovyensis TaxID=1124761 RepID=A0A7X0C791_9ACTN|nr:TetR/AcrR family transcriptional regulator [Nonomuraea muscovyensis]MBB6349582.1 AcrR family transcriptional regulator [Nonomuraea muscovyensis]
MARQSDTRTRIQAVARELFAAQGVRDTSLRQISDRLGITKPALYYHFASREDLVRSIIQPMIDDTDRFVTAREQAPDRGPGGPRLLLEDYFELMWRHREVIVMIMRDVSTLTELDLTERMFGWRRRLTSLLLGPEVSVAQRVRATVALGGMSDCSVEYAHLPLEEVKGPAVEAAAAALGLAAPS